MPGFSGVFQAFLFFAGALMLVYSAWRLTQNRDSAFLHMSQMAFFTALMLIVLPGGEVGVRRDWPVWLALTLLLVSAAFTVAHKRRRR